MNIVDGANPLAPTGEILADMYTGTVEQLSKANRLTTAIIDTINDKIWGDLYTAPLSSKQAIDEFTSNYDSPGKVGSSAFDVALAVILHKVTSTPAGLVSDEPLLIGNGVKSTGILAPSTGQKVFRVYGGDSAAGGASWSPVNPSYVPDFRGAAGLPSGGVSGANNTGRFVIEGTIQDAGAVVKVRPALPLDGNAGGLPEYIIPNGAQSGAIRVDRVSGVNPQL